MPPTKHSPSAKTHPSPAAKQTATETASPSLRQQNAAPRSPKTCLQKSKPHKHTKPCFISLPLTERRSLIRVAGPTYSYFETPSRRVQFPPHPNQSRIVQKRTFLRLSKL